MGFFFKKKTNTNSSSSSSSSGSSGEIVYSPEFTIFYYDEDGDVCTRRWGTDHYCSLSQVLSLLSGGEYALERYIQAQGILPNRGRIKRVCMSVNANRRFVRNGYGSVSVDTRNSYQNTIDFEFDVKYIDDGDRRSLRCYCGELSSEMYNALRRGGQSALVAFAYSHPNFLGSSVRITDVDIY